MITEKNIEALLKRKGYKYARFGELAVWLVILADGPNEHRMTVELQEKWVSIAIVPFIEQPTKKKLPAVCVSLAQCNYEMYLAKFVLNEDNNIGLLAEIPIESNIIVCEQAVSQVAQYAGEFYDRLKKSAA